ncbi:helix-turn-helix transcriptional regulator [Gordonia spumicola]|nr:LuxR family transcriptional regulator [Gordonia spumicola]
MPVRWPWVGRAAEFSTVLRSFRPSGHTAPVVAVIGCPGSGKSRLITEFMTVAGPSVVTVDGALGALGLPTRDLALDSGSVLVVDDADLLDAPTAATVTATIDGRSRSAAVLLTAACLPSMLRTLRITTDSLTAVVTLDPLDDDTTVDFLRARLGAVDSLTAARLSRMTASVPGLLVAATEHAIATGALVAHGGTWSLHRQPEPPPSVRYLVDGIMARAGDGVRDVLTCLIEIDELPYRTLAAVVGSTSIDAAQKVGLVDIDDAARLVRAANPMYRTAARSSVSVARLRRLGGMLSAAHTAGAPMPSSPALDIAAANAALDNPDKHQQDLILAVGAHAAIRTLALPKALEYCRAVAAGPYRNHARLSEGYALCLLGAGHDADRVLARVGDDDPSLRAAAVLLRVNNAVLALGDPAHAQRIIDEQRELLGPSYQSASAFVACERGESAAALDVLERLMNESVGDLTRMLVDLATAIAAADCGRRDLLAALIERCSGPGWASIPHHRAALAYLCAAGSHLLGDRDGVHAVEAGVISNVDDVPSPGQHWLTGLSGLVAVVDGEPTAARGLLAAAHRGFQDQSAPAFQWLPFAVERAELLAQTDVESDAADLDELIAEIDAVAAVTGPRIDVRVRLIRAWRLARAGSATAARTEATAAAELAAVRGQPASEVVCRQTLVRFGDTDQHDRLAILAAAMPDAPRAQAAAAHARALTDRDPDTLLAVAERYLDIGCSDAAVDAFAQASDIFHRDGHPGLAVSADSFIAGHIRAHHTSTPAVRAHHTRDRLTDRQRQALSLAREGLSNTQIAAAMGLSIRTVEGHLYRAGQILGAPVRRSER